MSSTKRMSELHASASDLPEPAEAAEAVEAEAAEDAEGAAVQAAEAAEDAAAVGHGDIVVSARLAFFRLH
jgi:hypothetical protein